jgi:hypothetical protein
MTKEGTTSKRFEKNHLVRNKADRSKGSLNETRYKNTFLYGTTALMVFRLVAPHQVDGAPITNVNAGNSEGLAQKPHSGWNHDNEIESAYVSDKTSSFIDNFLRDLKRGPVSTDTDNSISQQFKDSSVQSESEQVPKSSDMRQRDIEHSDMRIQRNELKTDDVKRMMEFAIEHPDKVMEIALQNPEMTKKIVAGAMEAISKNPEMMKIARHAYQELQKHQRAGYSSGELVRRQSDFASELSDIARRQSDLASELSNIAGEANVTSYLSLATFFMAFSTIAYLGVDHCVGKRKQIKEIRDDVEGLTTRVNRLRTRVNTLENHEVTPAAAASSLANTDNTHREEIPPTYSTAIQLSNLNNETPDS